jgi:uncharacterized damage-inducible protein DinB
MTQLSSSPAAAKPQPEPWLRGTLADVPPEARAILHALELAREDIARWCAPLSPSELCARPHGLPPVGFHLRHIVRSLDRLLTYAEGRELDETQSIALRTEMDTPQECDQPEWREEVLAEFDLGLAGAERRIRAIDPSQWSQPRTVGRRQMPTTVAGLLIHCADHTQRHVGQAVTTAKVLLAQRP